MRKYTTTFLAIVLLLLLPLFPAHAGGEYSYISPEDTAKAIREKSDIIIVDTRAKESFDKEHLQGALPVYSYPTNTPEKKAMLDKALEKSGPNSKLIIICESGMSARNAVDYFREKGIDDSRLLILKGGQRGWPRNSLGDVVISR